MYACLTNKDACYLFCLIKFLIVYEYSLSCEKYQKRAMRSKFNIYVYIYYTLDIENEQQLIPMSCDVPGVGFLPRKCSFLSRKTKLKFRSSMVLIYVCKIITDACYLSCLITFLFMFENSLSCDRVSWFIVVHVNALYSINSEGNIFDFSFLLTTV
jgi:hypothetical protein